MFVAAAAVTGCASDPVETEPTPCVGDPELCLDVSVKGTGSQALIIIGDGPGWSRDYLVPVQTALASDQLTVAIFDHRGTGRSTTTDPPQYTMVDYVEDVERVRVSLGVDTVHIMGHGFGASVAWGYLATYPTQVQSIINAGGYSPTSASYFSAQALLDERVAFLQMSNIIPAIPDPVNDDCTPGLQIRLPAYMHQAEDPISAEMKQITCVASVQADTVNSVYNVGYNYNNVVAGFTGPALVIFGKADPYSADLGQATVSAMAGTTAQFEVLPSAGHFPWVEKPGEFLPKVKAFLGVP